MFDDIFKSSNIILIDEIKTHCRNLLLICIYGIKDRNEEIAYILASYNNQLEYCHVEDMGEIRSPTITGSCKRFRFQLVRSYDLAYRPVQNTEAMGSIYG